MHGVDQKSRPKGDRVDHKSQGRSSTTETSTVFPDMIFANQDKALKRRGDEDANGNCRLARRIQCRPCANFKKLTGI